MQNDIKKIQKITWYGIAVNLLLFCVKLFLGFIGRSQALVADAVHSLSDLTTDFAVIYGSKLWAKPPDDQHPYGHRRIETMITIGIGIILGLVALGIAAQAVSGFYAVHKYPPNFFALIGAVVSIFIKEILYRKTIAQGKEIKSSALIANAWHHRSDAFSSIPVALAVMVTVIKPQWAFVDHLAALLVSLFIMAAAFRIATPAFAQILDYSASKDYLDEIAKVITTVPGVLSHHELRSRRVGSGFYLDLHIQVNPEITVKEGHDISEEVKRQLIESQSDILDVVVHIEPNKEEKPI